MVCLYNYYSKWTGDIIVTTLPPIPTVGLTKNDVEDLMERTYQVMLAQYNLSTAELEQRIAAAGGSNIYNKTNCSAALGGAATSVLSASDKTSVRADEVRFDASRTVHMSAGHQLAIWIVRRVNVLKETFDPCKLIFHSFTNNNPKYALCAFPSNGARSYSLQRKTRHPSSSALVY